MVIKVVSRPESCQCGVVQNLLHAVVKLSGEAGLELAGWWLYLLCGGTRKGKGNEERGEGGKQGAKGGIREREGKV